MTFSTFAQILFWLAAWMLFYVYLGYPLLVYTVSRLFPKPVNRALIEPVVSLIITAYNEERDILTKLENTLLIDYPKEKLEIIVTSDCSTDDTDEIVRQFAPRGVKLYRQAKRQGKTSAQNLAVEKALGEIIVFSDATTMYERNVLQTMLPNFADTSVGCVAGRLIYVDPSKSGVGQGAKHYWSYESFLKLNESLACSLIGTSGCLYGVRKSAYVPMYPDACSDFLICTNIYRQNLRSVYEPNAVCFEKTHQQAAEEFRMRVRIISQTFSDLWRNRDMLRLRKSGFFGVQLISHKLLRYAVPLFLSVILVSSMVLSFSSGFFYALLALQIVFYLSALGAWFMERNFFELRILSVPFYLMLTNLAAVIGFYNFLRGEHFAIWETIRDSKGKT